LRADVTDLLAVLEGWRPAGSGLPVRGDFPEQQAFVDDQAPLKAAFCTRRAAKSYSVGLDHVSSAEEKGGKHLVLGLTRESVRGAFWTDVLKAIDRKFRLGATFNETRLEMTLPGGGSVRLLGMDSNDNEARKALGQKYRAVAIDEAQDWGTDLEQLVYATLGPAVADLGGQIAMSGTPSNKIKGLFFDVSNGRRKDWSLHRWDTTRNTATPEGQTERMCDQWAKQIAQLTASNPAVVETPWFRQMYLGEWVIESDKLVYRYAAGRNDFAGELPRHPRGAWHYVLGVDLGYTDATAWTVAAYHDHDRRLFLLESAKEAGLDITATAKRIRALSERYEFDRLVVDNANKQAVEEMKRRHGLPLHAADKTGKSDFIELMNAELIMGNVQVSPACAQLVEEWQGLIWDPKSEKREEHPSCPNHCSDSALYAWRYCYGYLSQAIKPMPAAGSPEWQREEEDRMEREAEERFERQQEERWT
jgi:hypothetical protein